MRRFLYLTLSAAVLALLPAGSAAAAKGFTYGVTAAEVTSSSAILWTRADKRSRTTLQVATDKRFRKVVLERSFTPKRSDDNTLGIQVKGLKSGRLYYYRFFQGSLARRATVAAVTLRRSETGQFETAPSPSRNATVEFAFTGDADASRATGQSQPFFNSQPGNNGLGAANFAVYRRMAAERNDFNINFGDTIYSDSEVSGAGPAATTVSAKWARYRTNLAQGNLQMLRRGGGLYNHWDDHEFINDFSIPENGQQIYNAGVQAFRDYMPVTFTSQNGLYRAVRWGANLELFFLDQRSFRSAKADDQCINPQTGRPDLAPTAPQATRNLFSLLIPSLGQPVSQECKDAINDPNRTLLGPRQLDRFLQAVDQSPATFKVVINETPIQQFYALPYDRWEGYAFERARLLEQLRSRNVNNVVFLTTDTHANFLNVVRVQTLEPGGPVDTPYFDFVTGPVATNTFEREIVQTTGSNDAGPGALAFFKAQPPNGPGMRCANMNIYSYAQVRVTSSALAIAAKDGNGQPVKDQQSGAPCVLNLPKQ